MAQAAEIRWWRSYLSGKTPEDYLRDKKAYWRRVMREAEIVLPPGAGVLDAGCGPAGIFTVLDGQEVDAVDPLLERYAEELPHFNPADYPRVDFITESLENYRAAAPYDYIFCLNAINHVADIDRAMDRLVESMSADGTLWISIDAHRHPGLQWIFRKIPADILHPHQYTLAGYEELLTARGLQVFGRYKLKPGRIFDYYLLGAHFR
ncbi:class I SAM-dependent methyltransferase [Flavilitoribacter nigricans]|uniref:class I SAM-dependent methyltransferase n=1 Tax=Flavilitoribacter nigricans TaxID=70997 RepID=UPI001475E4B5|nr:class I SAM-dependent methyltransferase [Flavilitoribacter nigricans]